MIRIASWRQKEGATGGELSWFLEARTPLRTGARGATPLRGLTVGGVDLAPLSTRTRTYAVSIDPL